MKRRDESIFIVVPQHFPPAHDESIGKYLLLYIQQTTYIRDRHRGDGGLGPLVESKNLIISILDINDNPPVFTESIMHVSVIRTNDGGKSV